MIDASSQTNDIVTVKPHDISTAERVKLVPVTVGVNSTYKVLTKQIPDREVTMNMSNHTKERHIQSFLQIESVCFNLIKQYVNILALNFFI